MGMIFENLTEEELCDLMCGGPEEDFEEDFDEATDNYYGSEFWLTREAELIEKQKKEKNI